MEKILIKDILDIKSQPTVVSLDDLKDSTSNWIYEGYYITEQVDSHLKVIKHKIERKEGCGIFLIGHFGSGKSHFLAYTTKILKLGKITGEEIRVFPISLLNFNSNQRLEEIVEKNLELETMNIDRRVLWDQFSKIYPGSNVILLDELSEFLRSKPDDRSFNEDIRFLQFIGEWASKHHLWVIAAMQEQIEHTGVIESDLYRKIKDRYPIRLWLNPAHVKDLLSKRILRKKPLFAEIIEKEIKKIKIAFPSFKSDYYEDLAALYPLHPATIDFLEEVRDYYSQSRGIVEFCLSNLLGNPARGTISFCEKNVGTFITPDYIIDYFKDLFEVHPEFISISRKFLPFWEKNISTLFSKPKEREIANKLLNLLILSHISPSRDGITPEEASFYLLNKISTFDPDQNRSLLARIYDIMVQKGRFVKKKNGKYVLDLEDTSKDDLNKTLKKTMDEIKKSPDDMNFEMLVPLISSFQFTPFEFSRNTWHYRETGWHFHSRKFSLLIGGGKAQEKKLDSGLISIQIGLPWGDIPLTEKTYHVIPKKIETNAIILELSALIKIIEKPLSKNIIERAQERIKDLSPYLQREIKNSYQNAKIVFGEKYFEKSINDIIQEPFSKYIETIVKMILEKTYPGFERFAPMLGPIPSYFYREFMDYAKHNDFSTENMPQNIRQLIEGYLIPMKLMKRFEKGYKSVSNLESHELISKIIEIAQYEPSIKNTYSMLSSPIYGLVHEQISFLLVFLVVKGEIDIEKSGASYRNSYFDQPDPFSWEKIIEGKGLNVHHISILEKICNYFKIQTPSQWTALSQINIGNKLKKIGHVQKNNLLNFMVKAKESEDFNELEEIVRETEKNIQLWKEFENGDELDSLENFLISIKNPDKFISLHQDIKMLQENYEKFSEKRDRLWHLLTHSAVSNCGNDEILDLVKKLNIKPSFNDFENVKKWIDEAQKIYFKYCEWYGEKHNNFWKAISEHPISEYKVPQIAFSKLLELNDETDEIIGLKQEFKNHNCKKLSSLEYHPICECSFSGDTNPLLPTLQKFEKLRDKIENELKRFFDSKKIREKIKDWYYQENELTEDCLNYIQRKIPYPEKINNLELLDKHLSGLETFKFVNLENIFENLLTGMWNKENILNEIKNKIEDLPARVKFNLARNESRNFPEKLYSWIIKVCLLNGIPLPEKVFSYNEKKTFADLIQIEWIGSKSLKQFEDLGLGDDAENKILSWITNGSIQVSDNQEISPIVYAAKCMNDCQIKNFFELKDLSGITYYYHNRLKKLATKKWLVFMDHLANASINETIPELFDYLGNYLDYEWIVLDCFGLPFVNYFIDKLNKFFPHFKLLETNYAQINCTTTYSFWNDIVEKKWKKPFHKFDIFDNLLHEKTNFEEIVNVALVELEIVFKNLNKKLDPTKQILIFSDHGFRLNKSGTKFTHGEYSTLERIIPIIHLNVE